MKIGLFIDDLEDKKYRDRTIKTIKNQFKKLKPVYIEDKCISDKLIGQDGFDLVILDYGALTSIPGNSLGECYARYINEYAGNHPNTLFVYITVMGKHYLESEGINFDELHNIKVCDKEDIGLLYERYKNGK